MDFEKVVELDQLTVRSKEQKDKLGKYRLLLMIGQRFFTMGDIFG
ncbi:hypothetical protein [Enterococcus sp. RIT-PI-f]|nr:hypothetical protein [Enterococcus sp. RIT-PI-f]